MTSAECCVLLRLSKIDCMHDYTVSIDLDRMCHADQYSSPTRLATLRTYGLAHEDVRCFEACADQFVRLYQGKPSNSSMLQHSKMLIDMLQRNLGCYRSASTDLDWEQTRYDISSTPILVQASVTRPYTAQHQQGSSLVSLRDSADYKHYHLVVNALPVTDPALGDTSQLRSLLALSVTPEPAHVITHLLQTVQDRQQQLQTQQPPAMNTDICNDVEKAYAFIVRTVSEYLAAGQQKSRELAKLTKQLAAAPWVLVQDKQLFVPPRDLVYDVAEDTEHGKFHICTNLDYTS